MFSVIFMANNSDFILNCYNLHKNRNMHIKISLYAFPSPIQCSVYFVGQSAVEKFTLFNIFQTESCFGNCKHFRKEALLISFLKLRGIANILEEKEKVQNMTE